MSKLRTGGLWWFAAHCSCRLSAIYYTSNWELGVYDGLLHMVCWLSAIYYTAKWELGEYDGLLHMVCWLSAIYYTAKWELGEYDGLLHMVWRLSVIYCISKLRLGGYIMICCTWYVYWFPATDISKVGCVGIWWFAAHGLLALSHSTTSVNWDLWGSK